MFKDDNKDIRTRSMTWIVDLEHVFVFFYILIVFRFDIFKFHRFLKRIFTKYNTSMKWNAQGADLKQWNEKCI